MNLKKKYNAYGILHLLKKQAQLLCTRFSSVLLTIMTKVIDNIIKKHLFCQ